MTDEELSTSDATLIARWDDYVEGMGSVMGEVEHIAQQMRDRIEALVKDKERLSEALALIESMTVHSGGEIHGVTIEHYRTVYEAMRQEASIALDEIGYGTAALTQKDRTDD